MAAPVTTSTVTPPPPTISLVSSSSYLHQLAKYLSASKFSLASGSARLTLTPSALTLLHHRRERLRERLSDREAVKRGEVKEVQGVDVATLNKIFIILSSLRHLQIESSKHELIIDRHQRLLEIGLHEVQESAPVPQPQQQSQPSDQTLSIPSTPSAHSSSLSDQEQQSSSAVGSPTAQENALAQMTLNPLELASETSTHRQDLTQLHHFPHTDSSEAFPFTSMSAATYIFDFSLFPSLVNLELRQLPTAHPCIHIMNVERLKFQLEKLVVRSSWFGQLRPLFGWQPLAEDRLQQAIEEQLDQALSNKDQSPTNGSDLADVIRLTPPAITPSLPINELSKWITLKFVSIRSSVQTLDASISLLPSVEILDLSGNALTTLPPELNEMTNLQYLDVSFNQIYSLPTQLHTILGNLSTLILRNNKIDSIATLACCYSLEKLDASWNILHSVPDLIAGIQSLPNIEFLWLQGNPLSCNREYRVVVLAALWRNRLSAVEKENQLRWSEAHRSEVFGSVDASGGITAATMMGEVELAHFYLDDVAASAAELQLAKEMAQIGEDGEEENPLLDNTDLFVVAGLPPLPPSVPSTPHSVHRSAHSLQIPTTPPTTGHSHPTSPTHSMSPSHSPSASMYEHASPHSAASVSSSSSHVPSHARSQSQALLLSKWVNAASDKLQRQKKHKGKVRIAKIIDEGKEEERVDDDAAASALTEENLGKANGSVPSTPRAAKSYAASEASGTTMNRNTNHSTSSAAAAMGPTSPHEISDLAALHAKLDLSSFLTTLTSIQKESGSNWLSIYQQYQSERKAQDQLQLEDEDDAYSDAGSISTAAHSHARSLTVSQGGFPHKSPSSLALREHRRKRRSSFDSNMSFSTRRLKEEAHEKAKIAQEQQQQLQSQRGSNGVSTATSSLNNSAANTPMSSRSRSPSISSSHDVQSLRASPEITESQATLWQDEWEELLAVVAVVRPETSPDTVAAAEDDEMNELLMQQYECVVERTRMPDDEVDRSHLVRSSTTAGPRLLSFHSNTMQELDLNTSEPIIGACSHVLLHAAVNNKLVTVFVASMSAPVTDENQSNLLQQYPPHLFKVYNRSGVLYYHCDTVIDAIELHEMLTRYTPAPQAASSSTSTIPATPSRAQNLDREIKQLTERTKHLRRRSESLDEDDDGVHHQPAAAGTQQNEDKQPKKNFMFLFVKASPLASHHPSLMTVPPFVAIPLSVFQPSVSPEVEEMVASGNGLVTSASAMPLSNSHALDRTHMRVMSDGGSKLGFGSQSDEEMGPVLTSRGITGLQLPVSHTFAHFTSTLLRPSSRANSRANSPAARGGTASTVASSVVRSSSPSLPAASAIVRAESPFRQQQQAQDVERPRAATPSGLTQLLNAVRDSPERKRSPAPTPTGSSVAANGSSMILPAPRSASPGPQIISAYIAGDSVVDFYTRLLMGVRQSSSDIRSHWQVSLLQHPLSKWERNDETHIQSNPTLLLPPIKPTLPSPRAIFTMAKSDENGGRLTPSQSFSASPMPSTSPLQSIEPFYTDVFVLITASHVLFVKSTETAAQLQFRMQQEALHKTQATQPAENGESTQPEVTPEPATPEVVSTSLPPSRSLQRATLTDAGLNSSPPAPSPGRPVAVVKNNHAARALHKTYNTLLSTSLPKNSSTQAMAIHPSHAKLREKNRSSVDLGAYGSEGESTSADESDADHNFDADDEDSIPQSTAAEVAQAFSSSNSGPARSPMRVGRSRSPSSRARTMISTIPKRDSNLSSHATIESHPALSPLKGSASNPASPSASRRKIDQASSASTSGDVIQPSLVAMLSSLTTSPNGPRTDRSPSPFRSSLRRARELTKKRRGEEVTEEDLFQDIDKEYGGFDSDTGARMEQQHSTTTEGDDSDGSSALYIRRKVDAQAASRRRMEQKRALDGAIASVASSQSHSDRSGYNSAMEQLQAEMPELLPEPNLLDSLPADPFHYDSNSVPLHALQKENYVNLARIVLGLGMQSLRVEFYDGNAMVLLTGSKHLTSCLVVALQQAFLKHTKRNLVIENEDLACLQKIQFQVFGVSSEENLRGYEVVKLLDVDMLGQEFRRNAAGDSQAYHIPSSSGGYAVSTFFNQLTSAPPASVVAISHAAGATNRLALPGICTVLILNDAYVYLCEELYLFQHCVESSMSSRARDSKRRQNKKLQTLLREWNVVQKEDREAQQTASMTTTTATATNPKASTSIRRYRVLAVETIQQIAQVDRASLANVDSGYPFSVALTFSFGNRRNNAFERVAQNVRTWTFACSETTMQRLQAQLRLQLTR